MTEDEIERNRRLAGELLRRARPIVGRGLGHLKAGVREAAKDLRAGREKKARRDLVRVDREIRIAERSATPREERQLALLQADVNRTRREIHGRPAIEGHYTLVTDEGG
jgi:hypothetical protein